MLYSGWASWWVESTDADRLEPWMDGRRYRVYFLCAKSAWNTSFDKSIASPACRSCCVNPLFPTSPSACGVNKYLGIWAQLEDAEHRWQILWWLRATRQMWNHTLGGASKTSGMVELMFKSDWSESRNLAHWHLWEVDTHNTPQNSISCSSNP
ncbi:hypothetical protein BS47DRAFT_240026 [Hydnum rufescens UP504]|uniref:Uncharacterized protein n=1 Tax=Hydnum rufescens UP504 TaxID=1448309 RepID=A0A9P6ALV8_9AGAM|nr:hypothetical protein BS47DRAFT_240026 [Hydnum rufescens UP504]